MTLVCQVQYYLPILTQSSTTRELNTVLIPSLPWENQDKESLSNLPRFKSQKGVELGSSPGHLDAELMVHVLGHLCIKPQASEAVGHSPVLKLV